jgi:hypothetical protein
MPDAVNLGQGGTLEDLSLLALDFPRAYDALTDMLSIPDPQAGYGVLQGPTLWFQLELTNDERVELLTLANDDAALLYLLLRAHSLRMWEETRRGVGMLEALKDPKFRWRNPLTYVRKFLPRFGGKPLTDKIGLLDGKHNRSPVRRTPSARAGRKTKASRG